MGAASSHNTFCCLRKTSLLFAVLLSAAVVHPVNAQQSSNPIRFDIGTGVLIGRGAGELHGRTGAAAAAQLSGNVWTHGPRSLVLALNLSTFAVLNNKDSCYTSVSNPSVGCLQDFPGATVAGLLGGVEHRFGDDVSVRLLAGPSWYTGYKKGTGVGKSSVLSRFDFTAPIRSHFAFVVWGEAGLMPLENKPKTAPLLSGIGLRLQ